jgi:HEAT repeat protein
MSRLIESGVPQVPRFMAPMRVQKQPSFCMNMRKTKRPTRPWFALALALSVIPAEPRLCADEEQDLIAILQSSAGAPQKSAACQRLRLIGTAKAVPALAALLSEERTAQIARHALEGLPGPEAAAALREALGRTMGLIRAGVIDSLGWRGEPESVPLLAPLLSDQDVTVAAAAAAALGRIGSSAALTALSATGDQAPPAVQTAVQEALLSGAERFLSGGDHPAAAALYRRLFNPKFPAPIRTAAWRGLVLSDPAQRTDLVTSALATADRPLQLAALKFVRASDDTTLLRTCFGRYATLPVDAQLALLDTHLSLGAEALPVIRLASQSPHLALRLAACQAWANTSDLAAIPVLASAAARGQPTERDAARDALARLRGPGLREALLAEVRKANPPEKAELLRALGDRNDKAAADLLLQSASDNVDSTRTAALASLQKLALPETLTPLLNLAAKSESETQSAPVLQALYAVCQASPNRDQSARLVTDSLIRFPPGPRRHALPLLAELGTVDALAAAQTAARDNDPEIAREALRVLALWPTAAPATFLLELARAGTDTTSHTLALRGAITVAGQEPDSAKRLPLLQLALAAARRPAEKKQALGQLGQIPHAEALQLALRLLGEPDLLNEAGLAAVSIAEKLAAANPTLADEAAAQVLAHCKAPDTIKRAWSLRSKPAASGPFIRDWQVCGPYRLAGLVGATAVFDLVAGPEKPGEPVAWKPAPASDHLDLSALFPGQENCVAYLRTQILASQAGDALLLLGSDDGVKAWLNGEVVHSNNIDRGAVTDQDRAPIKLKPGANLLLLKVTQGGGGWSVCARIVGPNGRPLPDVRVER